MHAGFGAPWADVGTVVAVTGVMYVAVVGAIRIAGRRTLAQLSAFDVVVTIAVGTILGSTAVSPSVSFAEGLTAVMTLLALQVTVAALRRAHPRLRRVLDFRPIEVVDRGRVHLPEGWLGPQLTDDELRSQLRHRGESGPEAVDRAVLEPIGGVSVSPPGSPDPASRPGREGEVRMRRQDRPMTIQVTFDARDPHAQARFWAAAMDIDVEDHEPDISGAIAAGHLTADSADIELVDGGRRWRDFASAAAADGSVRLLFQAVPEAKTTKNRVHLDLHAEDRAAKVDQLLGLGATHLWSSSLGPLSWVTLADPEGNELCVA